eukprot:15465405-Alexandrium_andersonii.AAC.1
MQLALMHIGQGNQRDIVPRLGAHCKREVVPFTRLKQPRLRRERAPDTLARRSLVGAIRSGHASGPMR